MAEPTSTAGVAFTLAAGVASAILVSLGITWPLVCWAMIGCIVGVSFAPKTGRLRAFLLFIASCLLSAKGGAALQELWYPTHANAGTAIAAALGVFFHPLLTAIVARLPALVAQKVPDAR